MKITQRHYLKFLILFLGLFLLSLPSFGYCQTSEVEISVSARVQPEEGEEEEEEEEEPPPPSEAVGGFVPSPLPTKVIFQGKAHPSAYLTLIKNKTVTATFFAEDSGLFEKKLAGLRGGSYTFKIFAEDTEGRESVTLSFKVTLLEGATTTVSKIFIPPTIEISPSRVEKGETLDIFGQVFPESQVNIFISPEGIVKETIASTKGEWLFKLDTNSLKEREYKVQAKAFFGDGEQSQFSQTLSFLVLSPKCWGADLNFDGEVDIIDFSILLYFWHSTSPENICTDINGDGIVDLVDFSIMMHYWTG